MSHSVCVVTGSRSEYGLLSGLMRLLRDDPEIDLSVAVTGAHLSEEHGLTYREIEADRFEIAERVEVPLTGEAAGIARAIGLGVVGFAEAFGRTSPDLVVVLGDRFETFAAVTAAYQMSIPIAHIGGGDLTAGSLDDGTRHAITKMSSLHFTAIEEHRHRVIQLGEAPEDVFVVGMPGLDAIRTLEPVPAEQLESELGVRFGERTAIAAFHPVTLGETSTAEQAAALLTALDRMRELAVIFTSPNADAGGPELASAIEDFVAAHAERATFAVSMGHVRFLSAMAQAAVVVGNSSAGIVEAPSLGKPSVDIGDRQQGRVRASSTVHVEPVADRIEAAVRAALEPEAAEAARATVNPYGDGHAAERMAEIVGTRLAEGIDVRKVFRDVSFAE